MAKEKQSLKYCVLDVFTNERFKGNPLAVVFTEGDLELPLYENISREFGYSETSFIYYSKQDKALKVRSFTPTGFEVNGAGHNLLGAVCAALLKKENIFHEQQGNPFVIMKDKPIHLFINYDHANELPVVGMMQQSAVISTTIAPEIIAEAIRLQANDLLTENFAATVVRTEVTHLMVPLKKLEALNKIIPNKTLLIKIARQYGFDGVYCFAFTEHDPENIVQTRFFNPGIGIDEDAATGSAAGPLAGLLYQKQFISLNTGYQLLQGIKMNQPSAIKFMVQEQGILITGSSIITMEGIIYE
jgi:trans-2,3-dihydro-3-hydroxyanthranilate isomerase